MRVAWRGNLLHRLNLCGFESHLVLFGTTRYSKDLLKSNVTNLVKPQHVTQSNWLIVDWIVAPILMWNWLSPLDDQYWRHVLTILYRLNHLKTPINFKIVCLIIILVESTKNRWVQLPLKERRIFIWWDHNV